MKPLLVLLLLIPVFSHAQPKHEELVYGHKNGMALVMEKVIPASPNSKAVLYLMSGGYFSDHAWLFNGLKDSQPFLDHGYTVFLVFHGSKPRFNVLDISKDITRAVQFVRYNAKTFGIDPAHIGIYGNSSGGHLALYAATTDDKITAASNDPIEKVSSKVQAVCAFYPPTDFLNFGKTGANILTDPALAAERNVAASFDFRVWSDSAQKYITPDPGKLTEIIKNLSPFYLVSKDDAPAFILHGTNDWVVPIQQSEILVEQYKAAGLPIVLEAKPGAEHGWPNESQDREKMAAWFDKYLK